MIHGTSLNEADGLAVLHRQGVHNYVRQSSWPSHRLRLYIGLSRSELANQNRNDLRFWSLTDFYLQGKRKAA